MDFADPEISRLYGDLDAVERWSITNHFRLDRSPMLWFYIERVDSPTPLPKPDALIRSFLTTRFELVCATATLLTADGEGRFQRADRPVPLPSPRLPHQADIHSVLDAVDPDLPFRQALDPNARTTFAELSRLRERLTTPLICYLRSVDAPSRG